MKLQPFLTPAETELYRSTLQGVRTLLEFGAGGSTVFAMDQGVEKIHSVESNAAWIEKVRQDPAIAALPEDRRPLFHHADIGPVRDWGYPARLGTFMRWPQYHRDIWQKIDPLSLDCVFIDGRFRVACAAQALLRTRPEAVIVIHDFWQRPRYHRLLAYATPIASAENLVVMRRKPKARRFWLKLLLIRHWFDRQ